MNRFVKNNTARTKLKQGKAYDCIYELSKYEHH